MSFPRLLVWSLLLSLAAFAAGCAAVSTSEALLQDGKLMPMRPGRDLGDGKRAALLAFNSFIYVNPEAGSGERQAVDAAEMRDLTDAMLHAFLKELTQVRGLTLQPMTETGLNRYYNRLPGRLGAQIAGFSLEKHQGLAAAPYLLKHLPVVGSENWRWLEHQKQGITLKSLLGQVIGGSSKEDLEVEDFSLISYKLGVDLAFLVNNRVQLVPGPDGTWRAQLELVEVIAVGVSDLRRYAYDRYCEGEFHDPAAALTSDPTDPQIWALMQYRPLVEEGETASDHSTRDFARTPFWPGIAKSYQRLAQAFRDDLNRMRK